MNRALSSYTRLSKLCMRTIICLFILLYIQMNGNPNIIWVITMTFIIIGYLLETYYNEDYKKGDVVEDEI